MRVSCVSDHFDSFSDWNYASQIKNGAQYKHKYINTQDRFKKLKTSIAPSVLEIENADKKQQTRAPVYELYKRVTW